MTRDFSAGPVETELLLRVLEAARGAPSAGNTQACDLLVLEDQQRDAYWDVTLPVERRSAFPWPGLLRAPVLCVVVVDPLAYVARYGEPDKRRTGLGEGVDRWPVPFWFVDGGAAAQSILLAAATASLGACLFGLFEHERAVLDRFDVPATKRAVCTIAIGRPGEADQRSASVARPRRTLESVVHRGRW
jgi:nitroreductase